MTQPNRPRPWYAVAALVFMPSGSIGEIVSQDWGDGEWTYLVRQMLGQGSRRYAEHELEAAR